MAGLMTQYAGKGLRLIVDNSKKITVLRLSFVNSAGGNIKIMLLGSELATFKVANSRLLT